MRSVFDSSTDTKTGTRSSPSRRIPNLPSLTIFFPFLNDEKTVVPLISEAYEFGRQWSDDLEVIAIHGGNSHDNTYDEILKARKQFPDLVIIDRRDNQEGYAVIRHGFSAATKEWIFYTDGDGQYSLRDLPSLIIEAQLTSACVVNGYKIRRCDSWYRRVAGLGYRWFCRTLFSLPIRDVDCDFRLIRRNALQTITLQAKGASCLTELILKLHRSGARFREVPVAHAARMHGTSNYSVLRLFKEKLIGDLALYRESEKLNHSVFGWMRYVERDLWWYQGLRGIISEILKSRAGKKQVVYDVGCGTGANSEMLRLNFPEFIVEGIDISEEALALCHERSLYVQQGSATHLPWNNGSADVILMTDVLCMLTAQEQDLSIRESRRVLKPDGLLVLHEPAFVTLRSQHDIACGMKDRFTKKSLLRRLEQSGLIIEFATYRVTALFPFLAIVKLFKKLTGFLGTESQADFRIPTGNSVFTRIQFAENQLLKRKLSLPIGSSILILARPSPSTCFTQALESSTD